MNKDKKKGKLFEDDPKFEGKLLSMSKLKKIKSIEDSASKERTVQRLKLLQTNLKNQNMDKTAQGFENSINEDSEIGKNHSHKTKGIIINNSSFETCAQANLEFENFLSKSPCPKSTKNISRPITACNSNCDSIRICTIKKGQMKS